MPATRSTRNPRPPSRSRFQEGSMNDRASAAPPVHFMGPDSILNVNDPDALRTQPSARDLRTKPSVGLRASGTKPSLVSSVRPVPTENKENEQRKEVEVKPVQKQAKRGSKQLLGQVWNDITQKFRLKRDTPPTTNADAKKSMSDDRPSKEEVYANYHHLVASGFFTTHAIQSIRQPGPGAAAQRPSTSQANGPPPQWPLPQLPLTPNKSQPGSPVKSPASASSRGTKRAKDDGSDEDDEREGRKVRKTVSTPRDLAIPKRRSSSRLAGKRNISISRNTSNTYQQQGTAGQVREPNKLTKRVLNRLPLSIPDRESSSASRRNVSDMVPPAAAMGSERTLRPRRSAADITNGVGGLKVRPDMNRGIPSVPDIPTKFTYGEDRENHGPWRGLRRGL